QNNPENISSEKPTKQHHTPNTGRQGCGKNNNKQKPPNTLLSSQTTRPTRTRSQPAAKSRASAVRTDECPGIAL
ncbi:hypothetical protein, partial [Mycobacterium sp. pW045]|uniref:hypothetical protein n=1 Tax=Mycobacterium sp. pW045 TaxID=3238984 RepID=UPI00351B11C0